MASDFGAVRFEMGLVLDVTNQNQKWFILPDHPDPIFESQFAPRGDGRLYEDQSLCIRRYAHLSLGHSRNDYALEQSYNWLTLL